MISLRPRQWLWVLIAVTLALRLAFAAALGLGIDEIYTAATARVFALSTYDHPPMAWWLAGAAERLLGTEAAFAVRLPFVLIFVLTTLLMYGLASRLYGEREGLWAAVTLNFAPVLAWTSGSWVLPDGPLLAGLLAGAYCVARAVLGPSDRPLLWWAGAGIGGGIALLAKLHGVFLPLGVGLFLLTSPAHRRLLLTPGPWLAALITALLFLPVVLWNYQHHWISFAFQAARAQGDGLTLTGGLRTLGGQAVFLLPWLWLPLLMSLSRTLGRRLTDPGGWLMACLAIGPIAVFTILAFLGADTRYHWAAPGYLMLFPLLGRDVAEALARGDQLTRRWLTATAASLAFVLAVVFALLIVPWPLLASAPEHPLNETFRWTEIRTSLQRRGLWQKPGLAIAGTRWAESGRIDYALGGQMPVLCLSGDPRGYGFVRPASPYLGGDVLIIGRELSEAEVRGYLDPYFASITPEPPIAIHFGSFHAYDLNVYLGHTLTEPVPPPPANLLNLFGALQPQR